MTPDRFRQVEDLYHAISGVTAGEREALLAQAAPELRREVESLLVQRSGIEFLEHAAVQGIAQLPDNSTGASLAPGTYLGPYCIQSKLGEGGMGEVFRALDTRLGRSVALKIAHDQFSSRFEREARAISALNHPNICTLYDVGPNYMVMELVEGTTLRAWIQRETSLQSRLEVAKQVLEALRAAHDLGIVHRDLKPANIMVRPNGCVKVLDFGVAKQITRSGDLGTEPTGTVTGHVPGTPAYMSPEQIKAQKVDARSDLFAFGIILYEILTGKHPWVRQSQLDTLHAIVHDEPPSIPAGSAVEPALLAVVQKLLRKNPDERYSSAGEVLAALTASPVSDRAAQAEASLGHSAVLRHALGTRQTWRSLLASRTAIVAVVVMFALGAAALGLRAYVRGSRIRWAEKEAIPRITRLIGENKRLEALTLYQQVREYDPGSPALPALAEGVAARPISFQTTPPDAKVFISDYTAAAGDDLAEWRLLGSTPLKASGIPFWGYYRVRVEKEGFAPLIRTLFPEPGLSVELTMQPTSTVPAGMVWVPAGQARSPAPPLTLPGFWMDAYEVSNRDFKKFVDAGGYQKPEYWKEPIYKDGMQLPWQQAMEEFRDSTRRPGPSSWQFGTYPDGAAAMPVGGVSWYEAAAYAEFAGKSLPTFYEWFRAAGYRTPNSEIVKMSNFGGKGPEETGMRRGMAPFGTYDMAGNVSEWTATVSDGRLHCVLGAAWDQEPYRFGAVISKEPMTRVATIGFRCVRRATPPPAESLGSVHLDGPMENRPRRDKPVDDRTYDIFSRLQAYDKTRLEARIEEVDDSSPYWRRETITFPAAYGGERMMLHLFLPKNAAPPYQVVAVFGGSDVFYTTRVQDFQFPYEFLTRTGRAVVFPVFSGTLERGPTPTQLPINQERERALRWPKDMGQAIDYLETRADIDAKKLGYYGVSYGAIEGVRLLALEHRFKAAAFSSGGLTANRPPEIDAWNYAPRVRVPVLMLNGRDDYITPVATAQLPLFNALGTPASNKRYVQYEGGHANLVSRPDLIGQILEWFDHYLGPVQLRR